MENRLKNGKIIKMKKKSAAGKKNSPIWLIIFLCAIIVGLVWLVSYGKRLGETNLLNQEIQRLNQELGQKEKLRNEEIEKLRDFYHSFSATSSATPSSKLESKITTSSGEEK